LLDLNTEQAQHIEILRVPGHPVHGSDALHVVINVITNPPANTRDSQMTLKRVVTATSALKPLIAIIMGNMPIVLTSMVRMMAAIKITRVSTNKNSMRYTAIKITT
jgi:hypothetical protein